MKHKALEMSRKRCLNCLDEESKVYFLTRPDWTTAGHQFIIVFT